MAKKICFILLLGLFLVSCSDEIKHSKTMELMDTKVTITVYGSDDNTIDKAFREIREVEKLLSEFENSQLMRLNQDKFLKEPDKQLRQIILDSLFYSEMTDGSFDITVKPVLDLYRESFDKLKRPPSDDEINDALNKVGYDKIEVSDSIRLKDNTSITLGGIAKGYAIDRAIEVLKQSGVKSAMVNAGGDIRVIGNKPDGRWKVALENPRGEDYVEVFYLDDKAIATSGDYRRYFSDDYSMHHIMDPNTGKSATEVISVSIISNNAMDADALSTSVFVMGKEGMDFIDRINEVEGLIITKDKQILKSKGLNKYLSE